MNEQRELIYAERRRVLDGENMRESIMKMLTDICDNAVDTYLSDDAHNTEWDLNELNQSLIPIIPVEPVTTEIAQECHSKANLKQYLKEEAVRLYEQKEALVGDPEKMREIERLSLIHI